MDLTAEGIAEVRAERANLLMDRGMIEEAVGDLELSLGYCFRVSWAIALARCYIKLDRPSKGETLLANLDVATLPHECRLEFLQAQAHLALKREDIVGVHRLVDALRELEVKELYYRRARDQMCLELLTQMEKRHVSCPPAAVGRFLRFLAVIAQFLELKPNVCGLGINLNRIVEESMKAHVSDESNRK